ncbi:MULTISPECIES: CaiB/BaiF CoA transferase family protein [Nocardia]|uniref:CaiB/BaiF CoA transferase family protein n=1 Tax=Nocardia TaxID=1817 RepID=UPI00189411F5|nr:MULTISPECIES: CoA transferase [Nocardia]MBF6347569.1 CoA transferase [Nocardia flavorosea]
MAGPLDGLVVVDASWGMPAAISTMLLADYGARVVKLERPGGPADAESILRRSTDRGKWSVEADLNTPEGRAIAERLVAGADVFVESFGAGRADALGIGYDAWHEKYPELVYCSVTGYGTDGPLADRPGYEALLNARLGQMAEQQGHRDGPIFMGHPTVSYGTAFITTIGILAALRARKVNGTGQKVDTSLLDGMLAISSMNWWWNEQDISYLARSGNQKGFGNKRLITDPFQCADGKWLIPHTGGPGSYKRMMDLLGFGEQTQTIAGPEMAVPLDEVELDIARNKVPEAFRSRPRDEWLELFHAADIAALPVLHPEETFADDQVRFAEIAVDIPDPDHGTLRQIGPVIRFEKSAPGAPAPAPAVGAHNDRIDEITRSPQWAPAPGRDPVAAPLQGVRILDFSSYFATGFGSRLLSDLGAEVIKIEPLVGDQMRPLGDLFEGANRGKRTIALDLRSAEGQEIAHRLVAGADVVMQNYRPGKAEKIGLGYEQLKAINPDLIYAYLPGFGSAGPKSTLKSFAPLVSGLVGLNFEGAGEGNPPIRRVIGNEDLYNGFLGAVTVLLALHHRANTGAGQYVESPQLHSSLFVISEHCATVDGAAVPAHQLDAEQMGLSPLYRLYRTTDGWIAIAVFGNAAFGRLTSALNLGDLAADTRFATTADRAAHADALAQRLTERFAELTSAEAFAVLDGNQVPAEIPLDYPIMPELLWEEWALESQRVIEHHHPEYGWSREVGMVIHLSDTPGRFKGGSPRLGEHSAEILGEIGYSADEITALMATVCKLPTAAAKES